MKSTSTTIVLLSALRANAFITPSLVGSAPRSQQQQQVFSSVDGGLEPPFKLQDVDMAGNLGFDPMGFAKTEADLLMYREAEVKHARLAMLAAIGWPVAELCDRQIAEAWGLPPALDEASRVPSLLNGGLDSISPVFWGSCLGLSAAIDMYGSAKAEANDPDYTPGKLGFDPLHFYPQQNRKGQKLLELAEISNGRLAMVAISCFSFQEYTTHLGVVPASFSPVF